MQNTASLKESYMSPRGHGEFDLVAACRQALIDAGLLPEVQSGFDTHPNIIDATTKKPEVQRHMLNQFWNLQLLASSGNTYEVRYCLIPNGDVQDWLRLFKEKVVPAAVQHRLPRVLV